MDISNEIGTFGNIIQGTHMRASIISILLLSVTSVFAQQKVSSEYPQDYFRNPLDIPIILAGNFGECRPNHFHSGLDIKTQAKENLPVHAAAEGYIARVRMQKGGFGHVLYIRHPKGYTTVYAHLNKFKPDVQEYVKKAQYAQKSWTVDLYPDAGMFPVKKGELIAWSGNTGSSTAPHLHFEIRDSRTEHPLNPMLFGFKIEDKIAPVPDRLVIYNPDFSIYEQTPNFDRLLKKGNTYSPADDIIKVNTSYAGIGLRTNDYMNGSHNTLTFYTAEMYMDSVLQCKITLNDIGYDITRYMNAYVDYKSKKKGGGWVQLLYQLPNNKLNSIYQLNNTNGLLNLTDTKPHNINIKLTDPVGNVTYVSFKIKYTGVQSNIMMNCDNYFNIGEQNKFEHPNVRVSVPGNVIYDNFCFQFSETPNTNGYSANYKIHEPTVPLHKSISLSIKPSKPVPFGLKNKMAMIYVDGNDESGERAYYDDGWYTISTRLFGTYRLAVDTIAPIITPLQKQNAILSNNKYLSFKATDDVTFVSSFNAELDGKWICFEQKGSVFVYEFDEHCPKGKHKLVVTATDDVGNTKTFTYNFTK